MSRIEWSAEKHISVGAINLPIADGLEAGHNMGWGIRRHTRTNLGLKSLLWPLKKAHDDYLVDGFVEAEIGKLIRSYVTAQDTILEIGCGDMALRHYLPPGTVYNALDLMISEFHVRRVLGSDPNVNLVIASATSIPAPTDSVSLLVAMEMLQCIPDIDKALAEISRVTKKGGHVICSIANGHCTKYGAKGPSLYSAHRWSYDDLPELAKRHGLKLVERRRKGWWLPLPTWLTKTSYQLPLSPKREHDTAYFFYVFVAV